MVAVDTLEYENCSLEEVLKRLDWDLGKYQHDGDEIISVDHDKVYANGIWYVTAIVLYKEASDE